MRMIEMDQVKDILRLLEEAADGEPFILAEKGKPLLQVTPLREEKPKIKRRVGFLDGQYSIPEDFDTMFQDEIIAMFEGEEKK